MLAGLLGIPLCREGQTAGFPVCLRSECFLFSADVDAGCVDFVESLLLEVVEVFVEIVDRGDFAALGFVGAEGH